MSGILLKIKEAFSDLDIKESIKAQALANLDHWLTDERLTDYRPYIDHLVAQENYAGLLDAFWRMIPFGTGGRRGPVGVGPNRINPHTIALSVQGHCEYIRNLAGDQEPRVVVAYDVREFFDLRGIFTGVDGLLKNLTSRDMARTCAEVYAANGVVAYVVGPLENEPDAPLCTDRYISTPELSFLIRELGALGGLNISASHNHPDDNGGKFYNRDGGQEVPPDDEALLKIVEKVAKVARMPYLEGRTKDLIRIVPLAFHERFIQVNTALSPTDSRSARIAFSPLCGTGMTTVKEALDALGYDVVLVPGQSDFDGSFASVPFRIANPEVPESMTQMISVAQDKECDTGFATDPDADRFGMIIRDGEGGFEFVNGNEVGILLTETILAAKKQTNTLPGRPIFSNTTVTSSLQREIARRYGCQVIGDLMVGFKYIGNVLMHIEKSGRFPPPGGPADRDSAEGTLDDYVFGCEESHGYLLTPLIRDKDACGAAVHMAGLISKLKDQNRTVRGLLRDIYKVYGYYRNQLRSLVMEGIVGLERIGQIQDRLRQAPPTTIAGLKVVNFVDNLKVGGPLKSTTDEASRNVLLFELSDEKGGQPIRLIVRPSGTEPKTKVYIEVPAPSPCACTLTDATPADLANTNDGDLDRIIERTNAEATRISNAFIKYCLGPEILGDVYPEVPDESLLVSDLVPVDHKIGLCTKVLPDLLDLLSKNTGASIDTWLDTRLRPFGEDARSLVRTAAVAWLEKQAPTDNTRNEAVAAAKRLFAPSSAPRG